MSGTGPRRPRISMQVAAIAEIELLHVLRNPRELLLILAMPGVLTFLFGYAFEVGEVKHVRTAVVDDDRSALSLRVARAMELDETFRVTHETFDEQGARRAMDEDRYMVVVRLPAGLAKRAASTGGAPVPVAVSGIDTDSGPTALRSLTRILAEEGLRLTATRLARVGLDGADLAGTLRPILPRVTVLYNPSFRFINYVMPGIIGLIVNLLTVALVASALTREKELGSFEALMASPVGPGALLAGTSLPYVLVSFFEVAMVLLIARLFFAVSLGPRLLPALAVCALFVLAAIATGMVIGALAHTHAQALQVTVFYTMPAFLLSGALAPTAIMPDPVRYIGWAFPLTFFCHAFRDVSMKGLPLLELGGDLIPLVAHGTLLLLVARLLLARRLR